VGGHKPEKGAVRSRKQKAKITATHIAEFEETAPFDPFADRDRSKSIEQSFERLA